MFGLNTGSIGLSLTLVFITIANVNTQLFFNTRFLGLQFWRFVWQQVICVACLVGCTIIAKFCIANIVGFQEKVVFSFLGNSYSSIFVCLHAYIVSNISSFYSHAPLSCGEETS